MDTDRSLRQRLRATVLEASSPAGKTYNAVIFRGDAIPTGILTVSGVRHHQRQRGMELTSSCGRQGHRKDPLHCDACGASLPSRA